MERLIMEFSVGDGYTYSSEVTYPIVYSSKEDAITDFELMLIDRIEVLATLEKQKNIFSEENNKFLHQMRALSSDKRTSTKDKETKSQKLSQDWQEFNKNKMTPLQEKLDQLQIIDFGGQTFNLHNFVYHREHDQQIDYSLPTILSLHDYFSTIENSLEQHKKPKM